MQLGINYPWRNFGWDFGEPVAGWGERAAFRRSLSEELAELRRAGVTLLRWFLLGDGVTQGVGEAAPVRSREGFRVSRVVGLSSAFREDFVWLLEACQAARVQLLPVLTGAAWAYPGLDRHTRDPFTLRVWGASRASVARLPAGYVKGGRREVLVDAGLRRDFFSRVLTPLLDASLPYSTAVYAWDLFNEPEWVTRARFFDRLNPVRSVPFSAMCAFIREGAALVRARGFRSTVGFARPRSPLRFDHKARPPLGLSLTQVHYYPRLGSRLLPARTYEQPALLGELSTHLRPRRSVAQPFDVANPWPELTSQTLAERLEHARRLGYQAAIVWSLHGPDRATDPDRERVLGALRAYALRSSALGADASAPSL